ncbi:hypothetical protein EDB92DRAFT_590748 [Lactarius akahatsu]|uniref:Shugoshin C-terminal domain-containing protein n=1 Tax=Lactarius akahatsu TaxID=416441 RepID=A0AAD4LHT3_9AGAM|nr:hypothetical protein EDB92DRAFT_590748 [Lactarius akahatsu]
MSRRESRVSMNERQNDALFEFENFKKKFLLANKHITKLNSTLSVRIEELNAQISALHVENLRLRASEIALGSQLKKEREKSQRIITDAESAIHNLMKSFGSMRRNFNIPSPKSQSPKKEPPPRARRPMLDPGASPHANRLARPPRFPEIFEEDEAGSDAPEEDRPQSPTPVTRRKKPRSTSSSSHAHLLARPSSPTPPALPPPIVATIQVDINESLLKQTKKRISRRQSGLISVPNTAGSGDSSSGSSSSKGRPASPPPRAPSPAFGSPLRRDAGLAEEEEEYAVVHGHRPVDADDEVALERASSRGKKKRTLAQAQAEEAPAEGGPEREKRRLREDFEVTAQRLQDVTNAFGTRASLPPLDTKVSDQDRQRTSQDTDSDMPSSAFTYSSTRPPSSTPGTTPAPSHLPTPRNSSPPPIPLPAAEAEGSTMSRERRVRKSINYAEPKLNTKMRKPDPVAAPADIPMVTERRRKSRPRLPVDDDEESDGAQADEEPLAGSRVRVGLANVDARRRSAVVAASRRSLIEDDEGRRHSMLV